MNKAVMHLIHSGGFYGAEAVVLNLCIGLQDKNIKTLIGCFCDDENTKPKLGIMAESKGVYVEYIRFKNKFDLSAVKKIASIARKYNVGLMHSHGYKPSFFCMLIYFAYKIPYVVTCHLWTKETLRAKFYTIVDRVAMVFSKMNIAVSHSILVAMQAWKINRKNGIVINNGIDIERYSETSEQFNSVKLRSELGLKQHTIIVGTLGRLAYQKAHHILIESAVDILRKNKDIEFIIAGEGHRFQFLKDLTQTYKISDRFHFIGFRSDAMNIIRLLDIFVLCSIDEGLPIVLLEAMSLGKPIIATKVGEIPIIIQSNYNGILIESKSSAELTNAIIKILGDKKLFSRLSVNAAFTIKEKFTISKMASEYCNVYENFLKY